jgi:hypothetical protein
MAFEVAVEEGDQILTAAEGIVVVMVVVRS